MIGRPFGNRDNIKYFNESYKVNKESGCWEWQKGKNKRGYGQFWVIDKMVGSHVFSYKTFIGEVPPKMLVCHTCDNTCCVNPAHLFLGTALDNMQDKMKKGRFKNQRKPQNRGLSLKVHFSPQEIIEIENEYKNGMHGTKIVEKYGVGLRSLYAHLNRKNIKRGSAVNNP